MIFNDNVGIVSYGSSLPSQSVLTKDIELTQGKPNSGIPKSLGVFQKTIPAPDEDTITLSIDAAKQTLDRWGGNLQDVGAIFIGSESHPYAVKPSSSVVAPALGLSPITSSADLQFACKAGTAGLQICASYVASGISKNALAIGADTAQSRPGDILEFTAGAGAASFLIGKKNLIAKLIATTSVMTDTPDFWRRPGEKYPSHAGRFSGDPGYFHHVKLATTNLLTELKLKPKDIDWCVFHTPNSKFPETVAIQLGFSENQIKHSLIVRQIGNTYAAASILALVNVLDHAKPNQKILLTSYGSGAGSDSFLFVTTDLLLKKRKNWNRFIKESISKLTPVTLEQYHQTIN